MASLNDWSTTDANNNATPPDGWPEGTMKYSEVNDAGRAVQGTVRRFFGDINGTLDATYDSPTATYHVTLNESGYTTAFRGLMLRCMLPSTSYATTPKLTVNGTVTANIVLGDGSAPVSGDIKAGLWLFVHDGTNWRAFGMKQPVARQKLTNSVFVGNYGTGINVTTGDKNTVVGVQAATGSTTAYNNVVVGDNAFAAPSAAYDNVVIGSDAGANMSYSNIVIGSRAMGGAVAGSEFRNVYIGQEAGQNASGSNRAVAIGYRAGINTQNGNYNVSLGYLAGYGLSTGDSNVLIGAFAKNSPGTSGLACARNVIIGHSAGSSLGDSSDDNIFIGYQAGINVGSGSRNIAIGKDAGPEEAGSAVSDTLWISNRTTDFPLILGGLGDTNGFLDINPNRQLRFRVYGNSVTDSTSIGVFHHGPNVFKRVKVGPADSAGTGYRTLRIDN